jgi:hypothetical protein
MKLNNKGFGMKESLIYLCILLLILLVASCSVSSFYDTLEETRNEDYQDSYLFDVEEDEDDDSEIVIDDEDSSIVIDYEYYRAKEDVLASSAIRYARDKALTESINTIYMDELVKNGYLDNKIVDYVSGKVCTGYANVNYDNGIYDADGYLLCTNYKTEGFR